MWAPFTKSKGCSGSCEQKYLSASPRLVRIQSLARGHFSRALFECAPRWTCKQTRLCSRSRCCECLLEGTAALANARLVLCAKAMRAMQISWWERTSQKPGFSHWADCISQLTYTDAATSPSQFTFKQMLWKRLMAYDWRRQIQWHSHAVSKDIPSVYLWQATH